MIHQLLNLTRPLFVIDTETTGTNPDEDRIVEIGFQRWEPGGPCQHCENQRTAFAGGLIAEIRPCGHCDGSGYVEGGMTKEWRSLINPGVSCSTAVTKIHGITDGDFMKCRECGGLLETHGIGVASEVIVGQCLSPRPWPRFRDIAKSLAGGFSNCDFAGKNVRFDLRIIAAEMQRVRVEWSYVGARIVDADRLEQLAVPRDLTSMHMKYVGLSHDGAHGALSDTRAVATVIVKQLEAHAMLPRDLDALHELQWPGWLTAGGEFRMIDGVPTCAFGKHKYKAMRDVPIDYYDYILREKFSADVKALAAKAKMGEFPEV